MKTRIPFISIVAAAFCCSQTATNAAAVISFSGGGGQPMTMTLSDQISYTIIKDTTNSRPIFVFDGVGTLVPSGLLGLTGTITFTLNGGTPINLTGLVNNELVGVFTNDDVSIAPSSFRNLSIGDIIVLNPGTLTTTGNITPAVNASGTYSSFLADVTVVLSTAGTSVPEPSSAVLLTGLAALSMTFRSRRKA